MNDDRAILDALEELDHMRAQAARIEAMAADLAQALVDIQGTVYAAWAEKDNEEGAKHNE